MSLRRAIVALWPALAFCAMLFASSSTVISSKAWVAWVAQNSPWKLTEQDFVEFWRTWWWLFVKGWHVLEFLILTCLVATSLFRLGWRDRHRILKWSAVVGLILAAMDEIHQVFVPKRGGRVSDFLIDAAGVAIGMILCSLLMKGKARQQAHIQ